MDWNYRVVRHDEVYGEGVTSMLTIRSAYYDDGTEPDSKPHSIATTGYITGRTLDDLRKAIPNIDGIDDLRRAQFERALTMPILEDRDFIERDARVGA